MPKMLQAEIIDGCADAVRWGWSSGEEGGLMVRISDLLTTSRRKSRKLGHPLNGVEDAPAKQGCLGRAASSDFESSFPRV